MESSSPLSAPGTGGLHSSVVGLACEPRVIDEVWGQRLDEEQMREQMGQSDYTEARSSADHAQHPPQKTLSGHRPDLIHDPP